MGTNRIERAFRPFNLAINAVGGNEGAQSRRASEGGWRSKALLVAFIKRENSYGGDDGQRSEMGWPLPHPAASSNQAWRRFQPPFRPSWIMASETQMREGDQTQTGCTVHRDLGHCGSEVQQHSREFSDSHTPKYTAVVVSVCGNKTSLVFRRSDHKKSAHFDFIDCRGNARDKLAYYCANLCSRTGTLRLAPLFYQSAV